MQNYTPERVKRNIQNLTYFEIEKRQSSSSLIVDTQVEV